MRELGITYLKTASLELQLGPASSPIEAPTEASIAAEAQRLEKRKSEILFGAVGMRPMIKAKSNGQ